MEEKLPGRQQKRALGDLWKGQSREGKKRGHTAQVSGGGCTREGLPFPVLL